MQADASRCKEIQNAHYQVFVHFLSLFFRINSPYLCPVEVKDRQCSLLRQTRTNSTMSLSQNPLTGQMSGSMANFVTTKHGKQNVIRSKAFNPRNANTQSQQLQRGGFKLLVEEYKNLGGLPELSFPELQVTQSAYGLFMAANLSGAIIRNGAEPAIDYTRMVVANGSLPDVFIAGGTITAEGISVSYKTNVELPNENETDVVWAVLRKLSGELVIVKQPRGAEAVGTILIPVAGIQVADVKFCYVFMLNADGRKASKSTYVPLNN
jgi:hypothetical protein